MSTIRLLEPRSLKWLTSGAVSTTSNCASPPASVVAGEPTAASLAVTIGTAHADVDVSAAEALAKKSGCLKCHAVDKKKDGPSFKETAGKYKGKADAVDKVTKHITTNPKIKVDGVEETHDALKSKDSKEIRNVVDWILSR